jgi:hypothetical protein
MKSSRNQYTELRELLLKLNDADFTEADTVRLNELLRGDPEACELYLNQQTMEAQLQREFGSSVNAPFSSPVQHQAAFSLARHTGVAWFPTSVRYAAALLMVCAIGLWLNRRENVPSDPAREESWLATVLFAEGCEWLEPVAVTEGGRLAAGRIHLVRGTAVLRFDGGAEVVLRGGTVLQLLTAMQARIFSGEVVIRAEGDAAGFQLSTPASELTDLGTEFAVKVSNAGITELQVLDGQVSYGNVIANAGHAVRLQTGKEAETMPLTALRFNEMVQQAGPKERRDLMTHYEGFYYQEGTYQSSDLTQGYGWAGPWRLRQGVELRNPNETDSAIDMRIVHGAVNVPWPIPGGRLGGLEMPAGRAFRVRPMSRGVDMAADGITYFSLIVAEPEHVKIRGQRPQETVRLTFRNRDDYWGESLSFGHGPTLRPHIQTGADGKFDSFASIADEQSLLWVGKIIRRRDGEDEVSFRIYGQADPLDYAEPATWHVSTRGLHQDAILNLVILSSTGQSPRILDELRIGPTWRSVVPITSLDDGDE